MLAEFVETLKDLSAEGLSPSVLSLPAGTDPTKGYVFIPATKETREFTVLPPDRKHNVLTLLSMANAVHEFGADYAVSLWCSMGAIVAVLDDGPDSFRKDRVTLTLKPSPLFPLLEAMSEKSYSQKQLFKILTHDMAQATLEPASFTDIISALKFTTGQQVEGTVSQVGKNTMGRSIMADVQGTAAIPKTLDVAFDPWPNAGLWETPFQVSVLCSVFVDSHEEELCVIPQPGELDAARAKALDALCLRVAEVTAINSERVFAGTP